MIAQEVGEPFGVARLSVRQHPVRQALAAPIVDQHREASGAERVDHLEILLDRLGATGVDDDGAARSLRRRGKERRAQPCAAHAFEPLRAAALGDRCGCGGDERSGLGHGDQSIFENST